MKKKNSDQNYNYLSLGLYKGRLSYKRSIQLSKENIQHLKTTNFFIFFLLLWIIYALLDPDPDSEYGSGYTDLIESESETLLYAGGYKEMSSTLADQ